MAKVILVWIQWWIFMWQCSFYQWISWCDSSHPTVGLAEANSVISSVILAFPLGLLQYTIYRMNNDLDDYEGYWRSICTGHLAICFKKQNVATALLSYLQEHLLIFLYYFIFKDIAKKENYLAHLEYSFPLPTLQNYIKFSIILIQWLKQLVWFHKWKHLTTGGD